MRKITISIFLIFSSFVITIPYSYSQPKAKIAKIGETEFIVPSIELMIYYLEQSMEDWEKEMINLDFINLTEEIHPDGPIYLKGEMGDAVVLIGKNPKGVVSFDWYNFKSKESVLTDIITFIKPYYLSQENDIIYYMYSNWIVGVQQDYSEEVYFERILLRRKPVYNIPQL